MEGRIQRSDRPPAAEAPIAGPGRAAYESYLRLCSDYLKRQIIVYRNWPQRRWDETGYRDEKVFSDRNA